MRIIRKRILTVSVILMIITTGIIPVTCVAVLSKQQNDRLTIDKNDARIINVTANETFAMLYSDQNELRIIIDVRTPGMYWSIHIKGPLHKVLYTRCVPSFLLGVYKNKIDVKLVTLFFILSFILQYHNKEILLYCNVGIVSYKMAQLLNDFGFKGTIYNLVGGIESWIYEGYPIFWT